MPLPPNTPYVTPHTHSLSNIGMEEQTYSALQCLEPPHMENTYPVWLPALKCLMNNITGDTYPHCYGRVRRVLEVVFRWKGTMDYAKKSFDECLLIDARIAIDDTLMKYYRIDGRVKVRIFVLL